ncbi:predicted protein [Chaetoceros tenuissimus]|uniref:Uncharacterized protein n=1 Tax=Chaetoceros tenuissimus TaxID=426638 RepID=A0AAD3HEU8_9STRA|nr:predicted protein [Chaetoceros tenuissimus]
MRKINVSLVLLTGIVSISKCQEVQSASKEESASKTRRKRKRYDASHPNEKAYPSSSITSHYSLRSSKAALPRNSKMDNISLEDRWEFILANENHADTSFAALLKQQKENINCNNSTFTKDENDGSNSSTIGILEYISSISYSILLTTVTVLSMTSFKTLKSVLYQYPYQSLDWQKLPDLIPLVLSTESKLAKSLKSFATETLMPTATETIHKMVLMECWRTFWMKSFKLLRKYYHSVTGISYYKSDWEVYAPGWLRRGIRSAFVKHFQKRLQNVVYSWMTRGWEIVSIGFGPAWLDFEIFGDGYAPSVDSETIVSKSLELDDETNDSEEALDELDVELELEFEDTVIEDSDAGDSSAENENVASIDITLIDDSADLVEE